MTYEEMFAEELCAVFVPNTNYNFGGKQITCKFNGGVTCDGKPNCGKCGWNPAVAHTRSKKIRRELGIGKDKD